MLGFPIDQIDIVARFVISFVVGLSKGGRGGASYFVTGRASQSIAEPSS